MLAYGGRGPPFLLKSQQLLCLLVEMEGGRLEVIDTNTGDIVKEVGVQQRDMQHGISLESLTNGNFVMLHGLVLSPKDVLENKEETMWRGRCVGNTGDVFCGMNKTKLVGKVGPRRDRIVVMDFWDVEYPEGGTSDAEDGGSSGEEEENVIEGEYIGQAERSDGKDED